MGIQDLATYLKEQLFKRSVWCIQDKAAQQNLTPRISQENVSKLSKTPRDDLEREVGTLSNQRARYDACRIHKINNFLFSPCPLSALAWPRHSCQSTSLYSAPAFHFCTVAPPPCCLTPLLRSRNRLLRWGWNVSAAISRLSGWPRRLLQRDPALGVRSYWHRAWGRACCRSSLAKQVVSGLFVCLLCWLLRTLVSYGGRVCGNATAMARPGFLGGNYQRIEREIGWD